MKKTLLKIFVAMISLVIMAGALVGCGGSFSTTMKDYGETDGYKNGGFVRETENYFYLINGQGKNTDSNAFGSPVKGALIAVAKEGFGTADQKVEVVVPKLFVGTDYNAGIYIFGEYVYYATPSTDKDPDGNIANSNLAFARTKLDGTDTKIYFTLEGLSTQYRVVKSGNDVLFVFYDSAEKELATFNTTTEERFTIAKTDAKADGESLKSYNFVDNGALDSAVVLYTTTVYSEAYDEKKAEAQGDEYSRGTETFNNVYAYKVGEESAKLVLDGKYSAVDVERELKLTYTVNLVKNGFVYYKQIDVENVGVEKHFVISVADLYAGAAATAITNSTDVADTTLIVNNDEVYKVSETKIIKTTLTGDKVMVEKTVANVSDIAKLILIDGNYAYYSTKNNVLMRVNIDVDNFDQYEEKELKEQRVSDEGIHTSWYTPTIITVGQKDYLMVCDNSLLGGSYIKAIDLGAEIKQTEEDGEVVETYIDADFHVAVITDIDYVLFAEDKIGDIDSALTKNGNIVFDTTVDGKGSMQAVIDARSAYESLTKAQKDLVKEDVLAKLEKYEKAIEISNELDGLKDFDKAKTTEEKDAFKTAYESAKKVIENLEKTEDGKSISSILVENYRWFYQQADKYFNPAE